LSLERFFSKISKLVPGNPLAGKEEILARLNPDKIYEENLRSVLGVSAWQAHRICESAVRMGMFQKRVEVLCPDGVVAASAQTESELPNVVSCWRETNGDYEEMQVETRDLKKLASYRLNA
jgi:hypothetical protein